MIYFLCSRTGPLSSCTSIVIDLLYIHVRAMNIKSPWTDPFVVYIPLNTTCKVMVFLSGCILSLVGNMGHQIIERCTAIMLPNNYK